MTAGILTSRVVVLTAPAQLVVVRHCQFPTLPDIFPEALGNRVAEEVGFEPTDP